MADKTFEVERQYLTTVEASKILGVTTHTIRDWIKDKKLNGKKIGGRWFVLRSEFREVENGKDYR